MRIIAKTPTRIDLAGGWTDTNPFAAERGGAVLNVAINLYSVVRVYPRDDEEVILISPENAYKESIRKIEYDGNLDLAKAAIKRLGLQSGLEIAMKSSAPPGSGLGTSASMGVALLAAVNQLSRKLLYLDEIAELAHLLETEELGIIGGKQDQYAAAFGGVNFFVFEDKVERYPLCLRKNVLDEIQERMILCYTGKSRLSGDIHKNVWTNYRQGKNVDELCNIKRIAFEMRRPFFEGNLEKVAELMKENWENQKRLDKSVTNDIVEKCFDVAYKNGAIGGKACGAGGGGCIVFVAERGKELLLESSLQKEGFEILAYSFDFNGLTIE